MPKLAIDYTKTVIYKIQHTEKPELLYVGSSSNFTKRKNQHIYCANHIEKTHHKLYHMIRDNGGIDKFIIEPIEEYKCESRLQARIRENEIMSELNATLNKNRAFITTEERLDGIKAYYVVNRDEIMKKKNEKIQCECGAWSNRSNPYTHRKSKKHLLWIDTKTKELPTSTEVVFND